MQIVLGKAHARNQELKHVYQREMYHVSTSTRWWSGGLPVRTALQGLADMFARYLRAFLHWHLCCLSCIALFDVSQI